MSSGGRPTKVPTPREQASIARVCILLELGPASFGRLALAELPIIGLTEDALIESLFGTFLHHHRAENLAFGILGKSDQCGAALQAHSWALLQRLEEPGSDTNEERAPKSNS
jgi:hypothetical protein